MKILHGDSRDVLKGLPDASVDACVTDPPYSLVSIQKRFGSANAAACKAGVYARASAGFMGKTWDTGETAFDPAFWVEVLRVLKPGGHLIAFGGTRTYHRLVCAIEDAGFEVRDQLAWLFGSGFPKSHSISKAIDKAAGAHREVVGRHVQSKQQRTNGTSLNVARDLERGGKTLAWQHDITAPATDEARQWEGWGTALKPAHEPILLARKPINGTVAANVLQHGTGALNVDGCRIGIDEAERETIDSRSGAFAGRSDGWGQVGFRPEGERFKSHGQGRWPANVLHDGSAEVVEAFPDTDSGGGPAVGTPRSKVNTYGDPTVSLTPPKGANSGSAARFFYSSKAGADDRLGSKHPTVKPVDLMAYLCRLVTPPGGTVLDPFAGSGSTGMACLREGFNAILIEREAEYVADIQRRLAHVRGEDAPLFAGAAA